MESLFELGEEFRTLFDRFDDYADMEFDTDADGNCIDSDGNIISDPEAYRQSCLEAWFNTLDGIEQEFDAKAMNVALYIKMLKHEADNIEAEEKAFKARKLQKLRKLDSMKAYLKRSMESINKLKIDTPKCVITIRNNAESVVVDDERVFIDWAKKNADNLLKYNDPEIRKTDVKKILQSGISLPAVHLGRSKSIIIK